MASIKAQVISDLHSEFYYGSPWDMLRSIEFVPDLDFLLLPGDVVVPPVQDQEECKAVFEFLGTKTRHVIFTVGNHEYYHSTIGKLVEARIREALPSNFVWLDNSEATIEGVHFYGGALWFPFDPLNIFYETKLNDFNLVADIHDWVYKSNEEFRRNAQLMVRSDTVVLSHHLPCSLSTPPEFKGSDINRFFVSDESALILEKEPRLWVHGHTHHPCEYILGKTRVVCNPYGYPSERRNMKPYDPVVIEL